MKASPLRGPLSRSRAEAIQIRALRVTVGYALLASLWIALSDRLLERVADDLARLTDLQTAKGWLFVTASALGLQVLTVRILRQAQSEAVRANRLELQDRILREANQSLEAFSEEHFETVFQPLRRLHGRDHYEGTGIGLGIVRTSARRLGGDAGVEANMPHGCRFWIGFPTAPSTSTARPDERPLLPEPDQETPP